MEKTITEEHEQTVLPARQDEERSEEELVAQGLFAEYTFGAEEWCDLRSEKDIAKGLRSEEDILRGIQGADITEHTQCFLFSADFFRFWIF